ncbi:MAG: S9 family peptidase [Ignavibacteriaceae bacterium]|nr:S9 family peptidase [Ignavibacteriaceae bacterium]
MRQCLKIFVVIFFSITCSLGAQDNGELQNVLQSDYFKLPQPFVKKQQELTEKITLLLKHTEIAFNDIDPVTGKSANPLYQSWKEAAAKSEGKFSLKNTTGAIAEVWLSFFIVTDSFVPATIAAESDAGFVLFVNQKALITSKAGVPDSLVSHSEKTSLPAGTHWVLIRCILTPDEAEKSISIALNTEEAFEEDFRFALKPIKRLTTYQLLDDEKISSATISKSGKYTAVSVSKYNAVNKKNDFSLYLYEAQSQKLITVFPQSSAMGRTRWINSQPESFIYTESNGSETNIRQYFPSSGNNALLYRGITDLESYQVSDNGRILYISKSVRSKDEAKSFKRYTSPNDRWPWANSKNKLILLDLNSGQEHLLADFDNSLRLHDISPGGQKLLLSFSEDHFENRPFSRTFSVELYPATGKIDTIKTFDWYRSAQYLSDDEIIYTGGPSMFAQAGVNLPEGMIPNDYDTQLYIYNLKTKNADPVTKNFNPSVGSVYTDRSKGIIHLTVTEGSMQIYYEYTVKTRNFRRVPLAVEVVDDISVSESGSIVYTGSGATVHGKAYYYSSGSSKVVHDPAPHQSSFAKGKTQVYNYTTPVGKSIDGLLYFPVDFSPDKKYPCIVNYYGGTSPVSQDFEGRYPKNLWTNNGYFVYVVQPSGATGYGQEFSALHVNDWGNTTSEEVIGAVNNLTTNHPYIAKDKIGCIGASYGGFLTMRLLTKTDIFAAAISHAGISLLPSYWGGGYWGYLYSAVATAESYPWNRKDIYVDQSPVFSADKVKTPLLLLHGSSDTNVPPGESMTFYTALKILGKEVELIEIDKQDHHILEHDKRDFWTKLIIAWFDKQLKRQPGYWDYLLKQK